MLVDLAESGASSAHGDKKRSDFVHVAYATQERTIRGPRFAYARVIADRALESATVG